MTEPHEGLRAFERLVGTWDVRGRQDGPDGEIHGQVRFEWFTGGHFLVQHVNLVYIDHDVIGVEYIGYGRDFMGNAPEHCTSHLFDANGSFFTYVWQLEDNTLTIWGGEIGSPAFYRGMFSADGNTLTGAWQWPGGGYSTVSTRVAA